MEHLDYMVKQPLAGATAGTKDRHLEEVSVLPAELLKIKEGTAVMLKDGLAKASDGTSFYGVRSQSQRSNILATQQGAVSIGVRRKGVVFVVLSGDASAVHKGSYLKINHDGTFGVTANAGEAVGIASSEAVSGVVPLAFNADFYRGVSTGGSGISEAQVDTKITTAKGEIKTTTDKLRTDLDANTKADEALTKRVTAVEGKVH